MSLTLPVQNGYSTSLSQGPVSTGPAPVNYKQPLSYYINLFTHLYKQGYYIQTGTPGEGYGVGGYGVGLYGGAGDVSEDWSPYNLIKFATGVFTLLDNLTSLMNTFNYQLSLNQAVGVQLDMIGQILNCPRRVNFQPSGGVSPILDDATYLILLKATIAKNNWDGTMLGLWDAWRSIFPSGSIAIIDNQNMTADVVVTGTFSSIILDLINNGYIVPRPEGVEYIFDTTSSLPLFGVDLNNAYVAGVDVGHIT